MAIDKHISGAVEKFEDTAGTSHTINAEYIGGYGAREVFPNYGEVKTLNRISNKGYTGSATWYYPLLKLPVDNAGNYASAIVTGRIGGWVASNMSFCQFLIWNRDGEGITCLHMDGKGSTSEATNTADLVVYRNSDNTTTVYIKCNSYFTYDLNVQTYQSNATIIYNGQYSTTTPTGTLKVSGANATTRLELSKNGAVYNGGALALKSDCVPYDNASKDVYLGSYGIYSGTRPSSGGATLAGNGYWIKPSSVGVSSAIIGGGAETSEMAPNYVSVSNGKIKINSSGIVSDAGTFTFDGNPGSVATTNDLKNYVTIDTAQTITGIKTFNSPANVNGQEVATAIFKTSNGGQLIIGKEGPNSGTMLRFDQTAGTTRLQFRASATPGAMVWTQPEKGAKVYFDLTNSAGVSTRTTLDARSGTIALTSDIGNGKITIQKNGTDVGSFTTNQSGSKTINISLAKSDVGLGNVDNTADKDKSVKNASNLKDSNHSYTATDVYDYLRFKEQKIAYRAIANRCDLAMALADLTSRQHKNYGGSIYDQLYHQPGYVQVTVALEDDAEPLPNKFSNPSIGGYSEIVALTLDISDMIPASSEVYPPNPYMFFLLKHITDVNGNSGFYGSSPIVSGPKGSSGNDTVTFNVDLWFPDSEWEKKVGTATITCNATTSNIAGVYATKDELTDGLDTKANSSHTHSISQITNLQSVLNGKVNSDDLLKITGSSGFNDSNWHYRKIGHFIFNSSDTRNGAPVHISGVIGRWAQEKMIFDIFVCTRDGLKVNGFVRGTNPSCRLVIDNTENPNIFLAVQGFATYNITVDTFENAKNENNAVRGSFHIDWTGGDDYSGSDVGVTATNFAYKDLLSRVASQRAYYSYTGTFVETNGTLTQLCSVQGGETGKIICVHAKATSSDSELSIQRKTSHYYDYDCIAVAPTGYTSGTYISCTGVVPPRLRYGIDTDYSKESTYYIFGKRVSEVYVITFDLP